MIPYLGSLYETLLSLISLSNSTSGPFENVIQVAISGSRIDNLSSTFECFHESATCQALERHSPEASRGDVISLRRDITSPPGPF